MNLTKDEQILMLKRCMAQEYGDLNNWEVIIKRATKEVDGTTKYKCSFVDFFDENGNLVDADPHWNK